MGQSKAGKTQQGEKSEGEGAFSLNYIDLSKMGRSKMMGYESKVYLDNEDEGNKSCW